MCIEDFKEIIFERNIHNYSEIVVTVIFMISISFFLSTEKTHNEEWVIIRKILEKTFDIVHKNISSKYFISI